jgi:hypothetical protein
MSPALIHIPYQLTDTGSGNRWGDQVRKWYRARLFAYAVKKIAVGTEDLQPNDLSIFTNIEKGRIRERNRFSYTLLRYPNVNGAGFTVDSDSWIRHDVFLRRTAIKTRTTL